MVGLSVDPVKVYVGCVRLGKVKVLFVPSIYILSLLYLLLLYCGYYITF